MKVRPPVELTAEEMHRMCFRKVKYKNLDKAERNRERCEKKRPDERLKIYVCPVCSWYHLAKADD